MPKNRKIFKYKIQLLSINYILYNFMKQIFIQESIILQSIYKKWILCLNPGHNSNKLWNYLFLYLIYVITRFSINTESCSIWKTVGNCYIMLIH